MKGKKKNDKNINSQNVGCFPTTQDFLNLVNRSRKNNKNKSLQHTNKQNIEGQDKENQNMFSQSSVKTDVNNFKTKQDKDKQDINLFDAQDMSSNTTNLYMRPEGVSSLSNTPLHTAVTFKNDRNTMSGGRPYSSGMERKGKKNTNVYSYVENLGGGYSNILSKIPHETDVVSRINETDSQGAQGLVRTPQRQTSLQGRQTVQTSPQGRQTVVQTPPQGRQSNRIHSATSAYSSLTPTYFQGEQQLPPPPPPPPPQGGGTSEAPTLVNISPAGGGSITGTIQPINSFSNLLYKRGENLYDINKIIDNIFQLNIEFKNVRIKLEELEEFKNCIVENLGDDFFEKKQ